MGGFALTGVAMGAVVGVGVDGFGENEEGEVPKGGGAIGVGVGVGVGVRADFNDSMPFCKVAPRRCSKESRSGGTKFEGWFPLVCAGGVPCWVGAL